MDDLVQELLRLNAENRALRLEIEKAEDRARGAVARFGQRDDALKRARKKIKELNKEVASHG